MELIELKRELIKMLHEREDVDYVFVDIDCLSRPNRAATIIDEWDFIEESSMYLSKDVCELNLSNILMDIEEWMTDNEPYLTEHELSLKSEVNRHICILLTKEEL